MQRWTWSMMAMQDIRMRYRGSILGPFWGTLTTLVMVASMGFVYALIFAMDISVYLPFLTFGLLPWQYIGGVINEGCQSFIAAQPILYQTRMPLTVHIVRVVYRNLLVLAHNIPIVIGIAIVFHVPWGWTTLMVFPALALLVIASIAVSFVLGMVSARFRDVPLIISNIMQLLFFLTPIIWQPELLRDYRIIADANPLYAAVDLMRAPLLGQAPSPWSWPVALITTACLCVLSFGLFTKFRRRIVYWV
jgi:ABC-2 type transport system permease protein/lipopolysaccharide transport system permease protein